MSEEQTRLLSTMTRTVGALREHHVRFALTGGWAVYARGGPAPAHDVDVLIREEDRSAALDAVERWGMTVRDPAEDWLVKAYDGQQLVDLIHRPNERPVNRELLERAESVRVGPVTVPVMSATHLVVDRLLVFGPHRCDLAETLLIARVLREQVDWEVVRRETEHSPYAEAFLLLVERLGVVEPAKSGKSS